MSEYTSPDGRFVVTAGLQDAATLFGEAMRAAEERQSNTVRGNDDPFIWTEQDEAKFQADMANILRRAASTSGAPPARARSVPTSWSSH